MKYVRDSKLISKGGIPLLLRADHEDLSFLALKIICGHGEILNLFIFIAFLDLWEVLWSGL